MRKWLIPLAVIALLLIVCALAVACADDATVVSRNISKAADNFEVDRRIVFYNGITDNYILVIEGRCSIEEDRQGRNPPQLEVTCKIGHGAYKKHFLGISDNVTYFAEQLEVSDVSAYHYRVTWKPQIVIPDIDIRVDPSDGPQRQ